MWVVKLGGSLLGSPELQRWLDTLVRISDGKVVIVPGGSLFADAVREAQQRTQVSDAVAHELALLAMDQFGILLAGMNKKLVTASSELEIAERGWQHRAIIWLPSKMVLADDSVPKNWQVTSDSLSAWLANKIAADQLILVKSKSMASYRPSVPYPAPLMLSAQKLIQDEVIDSAFIEFFSEEQYPTWVVNKTDFHLFAQGLDSVKIEQHAFLVKNITER